MDGDGPKWRLEHASNNRSICQKAACKRQGVKFETGELRIGTNTLFASDTSQRWYVAWRHWACATKHQIKGLKELTENEPSKVPGFDRVSPESQEQIRLAFEEGTPVDKEFKDVRQDLAKNAPRYGQEYRDVEGYKADVCTRATACRGADCIGKNTKIVKGELRLGLLALFYREHSSWVYKHWACMLEFDLQNAQEHHEQGSFEGLDSVPDHYKQIVTETFATGKIFQPPKAEDIPTAKLKVKKRRQKKAKTKAYGEDESSDESEYSEDDVKKQKPRVVRKKRPMDDVETSEEEYVPKKRKRKQSSTEMEMEEEPSSQPMEGAM